MKTTMNNLCVLPFNSLSIDANGQFRACCSSGFNGFNLYAKDLTSEEFINNTKIVELRKSFLNGEKPSNCDRCWKMEAIGNSSFRHIANENYIYGLKNNSVIEFKDRIEFKNIQYLDITLGNKCNLACRMCNPSSSSLVAKQWNIIVKSNNHQEIIDFDRPTKDKILDVINKSVNLTSIYMLGGEPLVSEFHDEIVELLISNGRSKEINLHYNTNLQIDAERKLEVWDKFRSIDLSISIDGHGDTYEYIRWPGNWNKLYKNIKLVIEYSKKNKDIIPGIATTVQNLNVDNLDQLIDSMNELSNDKLSFYFIPVVQYNELDITPTHILENAYSKLEKYRNTSLYRADELLNMIKDAITKSKNVDPSRVRKFFEMQKNYDILRNQNLFKTKPHFIEYANQFGIKTW
jgi:MoaA/NifB/PqqE/SkfB family radical SAM enzyme